MSATKAAKPTGAGAKKRPSRSTCATDSAREIAPLPKALFERVPAVRSAELAAALAENPDATSDELAARFGVSRATIQRDKRLIRAQIGDVWPDREAAVGRIIRQVLAIADAALADASQCAVDGRDSKRAAYYQTALQAMQQVALTAVKVGAWRTEPQRVEVHHEYDAGPPVQRLDAYKGSQVRVLSLLAAPAVEAECEAQDVS